jgi:hypothetical protein
VAAGQGFECGFDRRCGVELLEPRFKHSLEEEREHAEGDMCADLAVGPMPDGAHVDDALDDAEVLLDGILRAIEPAQGLRALLNVGVGDEEAKAIVATPRSPLRLVERNLGLRNAAALDVPRDDCDVECIEQRVLAQQAVHRRCDRGGAVAPRLSSNACVQLLDGAIDPLEQLARTASLVHESIGVQVRDDANAERLGGLLRPDARARARRARAPPRRRGRVGCTRSEELVERRLLSLPVADSRHPEEVGESAADELAIQHVPLLQFRQSAQSAVLLRDTLVQPDRAPGRSE